jgi:hypothetical protein
MVTAIRTEDVSGQVATLGGAFGTGILMGWVASTRPGWATGLTLLAAGTGAVGALVTSGFPSQMLEGVGAAAMGALGAAVPGMLKGGVGRRTAGRPAPKQITGGVPTNIVGDAIASRQALAI